MHKRVTWRVAGKRRLDEPRRPAAVAPHYDPEAFGRVSEGIARYFGTARYLVIQTVIVTVWIAINVVWVSLAWDPYPFILLNLVFSTQAAYAAPLILLAQNRQAERDRREYDIDRQVTAEMREETDFLARELAAARLALGRIEASLSRFDPRDEVRVEA
jgi:uncharacterized membrane protein